MNQLCSVRIDEINHDSASAIDELLADQFSDIAEAIETASQLGDEVDWVHSLGLESSHEYIIASVIIVTDTDTSCAEKIALLHDLMYTQIKPYAEREAKNG